MTSERVASLLDAVHSCGAELVRREPDRIVVYDPLRAMGASLWAALREAKPELLEYLKPYPCQRCDRGLFPLSGVVCAACADVSNCDRVNARREGAP